MFNFFKKKNNKEIAINKFQKVGLTIEEAEYMVWDIIMADMDDWSQEDITKNDLEKLENSKYFDDTVHMLLNGKAPVKDIAYTGLVAKRMGYSFETISTLRINIFQILEEKDLDTSNFRELFLKTLNSTSSKTVDISPILQLLYNQGWIADKKNEVCIEWINILTERFGLQQTLEYMVTLMEDAKKWYIQVKNPQSDLQKMTNLALEWLGGELFNIYNELLDDYKPVDLIAHTSDLQPRIYKALLEAEESENFPKLEANYRNEVASRFLQYMTELTRSKIIEERYAEDDIENDAEFLVNDNKINAEVELKYISTVETTMGVDFETIENLENVPTKSLDFSGQILKINGMPAPHFKLHLNTSKQKEWLNGELGELFSQSIDINLEERKIKFTVIVPSVGDALFGDDSLSSKPSTQSFTY